MEGLRLTLVLGGGGVKAAAGLGAARALAEASLPPTRYVGTSMGAVIAALLAAGLTPAEAEQRVAAAMDDAVGRPVLSALLRGIFAPALLDRDRLERLIARILPVTRFSELPAPLTVTTTDIESGELLLLGDGGRDLPLVQALTASCALPVYYPPVEIDGRRCADGGLRAVLPLEVAAGWPADRVVAVDAGSGFDELPAEGPAPPALLAAHDGAVAALLAEQTRLALALWRATPGLPPLIRIRPPVRRGATFRADQFRHYAEAGYQAARAALALTPPPG
jgi:NTE family protein